MSEAIQFSRSSLASPLPPPSPASHASAAAQHLAAVHPVAAQNCLAVASIAVPANQASSLPSASAVQADADVNMAVAAPLPASDRKGDITIYYRTASSPVTPIFSLVRSSSSLADLRLAIAEQEGVLASVKEHLLYVDLFWSDGNVLCDSVAQLAGSKGQGQR